MKLDVTHITQKDGMHEGAACIEMILRYYDVAVLPETIEKFLDETHGGTDIAQVGRVLLQCGFATELITMHPRLFNTDDRHLSQEELRRVLAERTRFAAGSTHDRLIVENTIAYLEAGGRVTPEVPSFERVKIEINAGRPVLGLFVTKFTSRELIGTHFHFVVISGYRRKKIFVNDPHIQRLDGVNRHLFRNRHYRKIPAERFFGGIYANESKYIDGGGMLLIKKQV